MLKTTQYFYSVVWTLMHICYIFCVKSCSPEPTHQQDQQLHLPFFGAILTVVQLSVQLNEIFLSEQMCHFKLPITDTKWTEQYNLICFTNTLLSLAA